MFGIGEVARRTGLRPSAVRYYEECGLIEPEGRRGGKRVYDQKAVERLTLIAYAKSIGFSLDEIRDLLTGFPEGTSAGARWSTMAAGKIAALEAMAMRIDAMRQGLAKISHCDCRDLDQCAAAMTAKKCS